MSEATTINTPILKVTPFGLLNADVLSNDPIDEACRRLFASIIDRHARGLEQIGMATLEGMRAIDTDQNLSTKGKADAYLKRREAGVKNAEDLDADLTKQVNVIAGKIKPRTALASDSQLSMSDYRRLLIESRHREVRDALTAMTEADRQRILSQLAEAGDAETLLALDWAQPFVRSLLVKPEKWEQIKDRCLRVIDADTYVEFDAVERANGILSFNLKTAVSKIREGEPARYMTQQKA